jgi:hypothetical protein
VYFSSGRQELITRLRNVIPEERNPLLLSGFFFLARGPSLENSAFEIILLQFLRFPSRIFADFSEVDQEIIRDLYVPGMVSSLGL